MFTQESGTAHCTEFEGKETEAPLRIGILEFVFQGQCVLVFVVFRVGFGPDGQGVVDGGQGHVVGSIGLLKHGASHPQARFRIVSSESLVQHSLSQVELTRFYMGLGAGRVQ